MDEQPTIGDRLKHAWNAFRFTENETPESSLDPRVLPLGSYGCGVGTSIRGDKSRFRVVKEKSVVTSLYNKIAIDVSAISIKHVKINQNGRYIETINSGLNNCLNVEANLDQTGRELIFDIVFSMFDEGHVAVVPVDTSVDVLKTGSYEILSLRTGKIVEWFPKHVAVEVYDENDGNRKRILLPKDKVAIIENPFYAVMNEPNSTLKRLVHKLALLDYVDDQSSKSDLNLIIKLPYSVKSPTRKKQAEERRQDLESQLSNSEYGVAYVDATENITQLNRSVNNNLLDQIQDLTATLYSELGITKEIFDGTADEQTQLNYYNSTVEPILSAIVNEMIRKFLTKTARSQGQTIQFIRDPFRLVPVNNIADIADKFTRNEILSSNEVRSLIGVSPIDDIRADELRNKNLNISDRQIEDPVTVKNE